VSPKVGLLEETRGGGKKENDKEWIILKCIAFLWEQDTMKH
jgi:hypothetical protein